MSTFQLESNFLYPGLFLKRGGGRVAKFGVGERGINKAYIFLYSSRLFLYSCIALSSPWMSPLCLFLGASCPSPRDLSRLILASSLNLLFSVFKFYKKVTLLLVQSNIPVCTYSNTSSNNHSFYWVLFVKKNEEISLRLIFYQNSFYYVDIDVYKRYQILI